MKQPRKTRIGRPSPGSEQPRRIRSYVLRKGRITPAQQRALVDLWPVYGLDPPAGEFSWNDIFGRDGPRTLEIGFGNGENLVQMASANPAIDFIGVEVHEPGIGHCLLEAREHGLTNLKVVRADAVEVLRNNVPDESLARINLFFPDPWHKKRHHKRRIVQPAFIDVVAAKLEPGGIFHVVTDWPDYAEHIGAVMSSNPAFDALQNAPEDRQITRFDDRGARLGHQNWERAWCKRSKVNRREK